MAETTSPAGATPADVGATPTAASPASTEASTATQPATGAPVEDQSLGDGGKRALEAERAARREVEKRLKAFEDEKAKADEAKLSDLEKANKRYSDLEKKNEDEKRAAQERVLRFAARAEAIRLGMKPDLIHKLLDHSAIEYDEDGNPTNLTAQIEQLAKDNPELVGAKGGTADGGASTRGPASLTRDQIKRMTPDEINSHWDEVQRALTTAR